MVVITKGLRFHVFLKMNNVRSNFFRTVVIYAVGIFLSFITPGHVGDFSKIYYLKKEYSVDYLDGIMMNVIDRLFDFTILFSISWIVLIRIFDMVSIYNYLLYAVIILLTAGIVLKYNKEILNWLAEKASKLFKKEKLAGRGKPSAINLLSTKTLIPFSLSLIPNFIIFYQLFYIAYLLNLQENFILLSSMLSLASIVSMIPVTILGLGTRDATFITVLGSLGYNKAISLSLSFSFFLFNNIAVLLVGLLFFLFYKRSAPEIKPGEER